MYEGAPNHPEPDRFWEIIERAPGHDLLHRADRDPRLHASGASSARRSTTSRRLRLLGTVGEPINPEAWMWYHRVIGGERCPIVDTWWQTETGGIMISPLPGRDRRPSPARPRCRCPASCPRSWTSDGKPVGANQGGFLVITQPVARMLRTIYGDDERYKQQYWSQMPGMLLHRRRRAPRRGRLLLDHGPRRRRAQRRRPPARHDGGRERAGQPSRGRRGRRRRPAGRAQGPGASPPS